MGLSKSLFSMKNKEYNKKKTKGTMQTSSYRGRHRKRTQANANSTQYKS
jgi:hypothetical protein